MCDAAHKSKSEFQRLLVRVFFLSLFWMAPCCYLKRTGSWPSTLPCSYPLPSCHLPWPCCSLAVSCPGSLPPSTQASPLWPLAEPAPGGPVWRWGSQIPSWESQEPLRETPTANRSVWELVPTEMIMESLLCSLVSGRQRPRLLQSIWQRIPSHCETCWILWGICRTSPGWEQWSVEK